MKINLLKTKFIASFVILAIFAVLLSTTKGVIVNASTNLSPLVCIDTPTANSKSAISNNQLTVSGWSLNSSGVKKVQLYLDNKYKSDAAIGLSRPDVNKAIPGYTGGATSGYNANVNIAALSYGSHTLTVKSIGNDGSVTTNSTGIYKVPSISKRLTSQVYIDTPKANSNVSIVNNQLTVKGWSLNGYGVQKVQLYLDNKYKSDAAIGLSRPDVDKAIPGYYGGATSGYSGNVAISAVSEGTHTLIVKSIGNDGTIKIGSVSFKKVTSQSMPGKIYIDTPRNSQINTNQLTVSGWSLDVYGVQKVQVYVDNTYKSDAKIGGYRPDVNKAIPGYTGGVTSGYNANVNIAALSYGSHTLTVKSIGNDGSVTTNSTGIYKVPSTSKRLTSQVYIDTPKANSNVSIVNNQLTVNGWSLNGYGVQKVQLYLDNKYKSDAAIGLSRPDVDKAIPGYYGGRTSGYIGTVDISTASEGKHTVTVKSIGNDGTIKTQDVSIKKVTSKSMPGKICIDTPRYSQVNTNKLSVQGWSLDVYGVQKVQVYVDNAYKSDARTRVSRPDVNKAIPGYTGGATSGYYSNVDISSLSYGIHTVKVNSIGNDGSITSNSTGILKLPNRTISLPSKICVDTPSNGKFITASTGQIAVQGWSLNAFGVQKVQVYANNVYKGDATIGISRPDVDKAIPGYTGGATSGYSYNFSVSSLADGLNTLSVKSLGNDGSVAAQDLKIYKFSGSGQCTKYNLTLSQMVSKQMSYGEPVASVNWDWVSADRSTVQKYVNPLNFMDNYGMYQFLRLDYIKGVTADDLNKILSGKGVLSGKGAQFLLAAQQSNINPIYLVSHALLETGNGQSALATGINVNHRATYNLFGIHAFDSNANAYGSQYAYSQSWFSVDAAIYGGASWISRQYINNSTYKQNTLYKMRWNPASPANHQYATDVSWAYNQIYNIKKLMDMVSNPALQFDIPQYN